MTPPRLFLETFPWVLSLAICLTGSANAAIKTWDGGATGSSNWSGNGSAGANNWDPNGTPSANDDLVFAGTTRLDPFNNTTAATSYASITFSSGAGTFVLGGNSITLGGNVTSNSTSLQTINMNLILSGTRTFNAASGEIAAGGVISGANGITKTGSNILRLTAANTYTGATSVTTGSLRANNTTGSATGTGAVSVGAGGRLGGTGTIAPTGINGINVSGVLAPGGSVGTGNLTFNLGSTSGNVALGSSAALEYDLGISGGSINSFGTSDMLTLASAAAGDFGFNNNIINFLGGGSVGFYKLFDTSSNNAGTWTGLGISGSGLITSGLTVSNLASGLSGNLIMGGSLLGGTSGDIYLQVVPEPSVMFLGGLGSLLLLRRRRTP